MENDQFSSWQACPIRESTLVPIYGEALHAILEDCPWLQVYKNSADEPCGYVEPAISGSLLTKTHGREGRQLFDLTAHDAGFALLGLFQTHCKGLRHPYLVPPKFFSQHNVVISNTGLPSNLSQRWLLFLHLLGWQQMRDFPIRAKRFVWDGNASASFGDIEELREQKFPIGGGLDWLQNLRLPLPYFGSDLVQDINLASVYAIDAILSDALTEKEIDCNSLIRKLQDIKPGKINATDYHALVFQIFSALFCPSLSDGEVEAAIDKGRARVDIFFENRAEAGFFWELRLQHGLKCPFMFFECKNYSADIGPEEFAQLHSRLDDRRGKVGFLVCRHLNNPQAALRRCQDYFDKGTLIMVLTDRELKDMLTAKANGVDDAVWSVLRAQQRSIILKR